MLQSCATPQTAAHQAPPSLGFSRQEDWRGLPFPSPMHACIPHRFSRVRLRHYGQQPTRLLCPQDSLGKNTGMGCHFLLHKRIPLSQKKEKIISFAATWMYLAIVILSEMSQRKTNIISLICEIFKNGTNELISQF